jgi:hypothetical protein
MCEPIIYKMWEPRRPRTPWASTSCYRDSITFSAHRHLVSKPYFLVSHSTTQSTIAQLAEIFPASHAHEDPFLHTESRLSKSLRTELYDNIDAENYCFIADVELGFSI